MSKKKKMAGINAKQKSTIVKDSSVKNARTHVVAKNEDPFFRDLMNYANEPSRIWNEHIQYCKEHNIKINGWGLIED